MTRPALLLHAQRTSLHWMGKLFAIFAEKGRTAHEASRSWGLRVYTKSSKTMLVCMSRSEDAAFELWRRKSGFPLFGWASHLPSLDRVLPESELSPAAAFFRIINAPDTPWNDASCSPDFKTLFSWHAHRISGHPLAPLNVVWCLARIPNNSRHFRRHFLTQIHSLDPQWAVARDGGDTTFRRLLNHPSTQQDWVIVREAREEAASYLEHSILFQHTAEPALNPTPFVNDPRRL